MTVVAVESQVVWVGCLVSECIEWPIVFTKLTCCLFGELLEVGIIPLRFSYVITCDILWYFLRILTATHASCFTVVFSLLLFLWKEIARIQRTFHKFDQDSKSPVCTGLGWDVFCWQLNAFGMDGWSWGWHAMATYIWSSVFVNLHEYETINMLQGRGWEVSAHPSQITIIGHIKYVYAFPGFI